ncbi:Uncharacterised protein [Achromobacter xylosoxidans]|nr:Uncharacterised protein [Achromobacter xylosoxidans]
MRNAAVLRASRSRQIGSAHTSMKAHSSRPSAEYTAATTHGPNDGSGGSLTSSHWLPGPGMAATKVCILSRMKKSPLAAMRRSLSLAL